MNVSVTDLHLTRSGRTVLQIPRLNFPSGTITAVFGPNGSGKTTLLRAIAGLERPVRGDVRLGGVPVGQDQAARRRVAMAFQSAVFLRGSVRQNLDLALRLRDVPAGERESRIADAAAECGVAHLIDRPVSQLSSGEAQRINLARALALRASVTLLDEPLAGLDRRSRTQLLAELPAWLARFPSTTILVTHDREEAFRLADRLVVLVGGEVKAAGVKASVYAHPPNRATAELLGYTVLAIDDTPVAIPAGALRPGLGTPEFTLEVAQVIDMGNHLHVIGMIGDERVDVRLPSGVSPPLPGANMKVHAASDPITLSG